MPTLSKIAKDFEIIHTVHNVTERSVTLHFNINSDLIQYTQTVKNIIYVFNLLRY